jgi:hypothetical protein
MYKLQGKLPETMMMGPTADISFNCEFEWYSWVYYNESNIQFPENKIVIGSYFGPTVPEVGSVMKAKILKHHEEVLRRNPFIHIRREAFDTEACIKVFSKFNVAVGQKLGDPMDKEDLKPEAVVASVTPEYEVYDDNDLKAMPTIEIDDYVGTDKYNPDINDRYIKALVLLPREDEFSHGKV